MISLGVICGGVGVNRKWSKISKNGLAHLSVVGLPGSDMGLVWGSCGKGVGVNPSNY